jgi:putative ABC transport system permease protein
MAVAMFAIVTFMLVYMSVFKDVLTQNFFGQVGPESGGWQVVAGTPDNNFQPTGRTVFPADVAALVRADKSSSSEVQAVGWENQAMGVEVRQVRADGTTTPPNPVRREVRSLHVVDDGYLAGTTYALQPRAAGFATDRAAWDAVRDHPGYVILDSSVLDSQGGAPSTITGIKSSDATFKPFQVQLFSGPKGSTAGVTPKTWTVTVVGFLNRPLWGGVYVSTRTAMGSGYFVDPKAPGTGTAALNTHLVSLAPTGYYFSLKPGAAAGRTRLELGRLLVKDQLEPVVVADQVGAQLSGFLTLLNLLTGFLALGLIVGIAGLGVISTRAVVERWQSIGMLRALGYRRSMVQGSFLMESSFIAILGLVIGGLVGLWQSYRFFVTDQALGASVIFHVPVLEIAIILAGAYLATLLTTFLPARAASRIAPAEALRYE